MPPRILKTTMHQRAAKHEPEFTSTPGASSSGLIRPATEPHVRDLIEQQTDFDISDEIRPDVPFSGGEEDDEFWPEVPCEFLARSTLRVLARSTYLRMARRRRIS